MEFTAYDKASDIIAKLVDNDENAEIFFNMSTDYIKKYNKSNLISVNYIDGIINNNITISGGFDLILNMLDNEIITSGNYKPISIIVTTVLLVNKKLFTNLQTKLNNESNEALKKNIQEEIDNLDYKNIELFPRDCHSVFIICDKDNKKIYFYDPNGERPHKVWYYINNNIYKGCQELKQLISEYSKLYDDIIVPIDSGIQSIPKGYNENNSIIDINDYRPNTKYIDCGWCMFYNLFAIEYIIQYLSNEDITENLTETMQNLYITETTEHINKKSTIYNIYNQLITCDIAYSIFPLYCKESLANDGTAHKYKENTIEKYSYEIAQEFIKKI